MRSHLACAVEAGKYLARWGFTPQQPIKRAYEQQPALVQAWLDERYPAIAARAKAEQGDIHWGDETALVNCARAQLFSQGPHASDDGGGGRPAKALHDCQRDQPGQGALDDH